MDTARQVLRFSIPGSITLLSALGFLVVGRLLQHDSWEGIADAVSTNVSAVVAIFAAIPLGFLIYQVYYSTYRALVWPWPWPWAPDEHWVRIDRGAQILASLPAGQRKQIEAAFDVRLELDPILQRATSWAGSQAHAYELRPSFVAAAKQRGENPYTLYRKQWQLNWNVVRALVEISDGSDIGGAIKSEYTILSDLYHALGACRTGVQIAWSISSAACVGYVIAGEGLGASLLSVALTLIVAAAMFWVFHRTRGSTWSSAQAAMTLGLTGLFKRRPDLLGTAE